jgi:Lrp/AsnC family transcriptional regulator, leucine-responsive regulatory protein
LIKRPIPSNIDANGLMIKVSLGAGATLVHPPACECRDTVALVTGPAVPARADPELARPALADPIDRQIAIALLLDGRSTLKSLAEITGLSVSAVQARVRRLESDGVIRGYTALLDPESIGLPLAALIAITPLDPAQPDDAPDRLAGLTEIEACHSVAGDASYVLFVRVASPTALEQLIREIRKRANVATRTTVVLQTFFERRAAPRP